METWVVEVFDKDGWKEELRYYYFPKLITDFDLHDIEGKRRNARLI